MKKLFMLTAFICSVMLSPVAHAEWTLVGLNTKGIKYVDFERIIKQDGKVYFWALDDFLKPNKHGVVSIKLYHEAECSRFRYRRLSVAAYDSQMGKGKLIASSDKPDKDWHYPIPDSVGDSLLLAVCNHKP